MTSEKKERLSLIEGHLRDLDELEQKARSWFQTEPWLMDEINKRRFHLISEMGQRTV